VSGRKSKTKGASGERELAVKLSWLFEVDVCRGRQYHGGPNSPDIKIDIPGLNIECKRAESFSLYKAMEQSAKDAGDGVPTVAHRRNHKPWLFVCYLDDLPRLVRLLHGRLESEGTQDD